MKNEKIVFYPTSYENYYASKDGDIYSVATKKCLSPKYDKDGYCEYGLTINGKIRYIRGHRIIAETFLSNIDGKPTVNHKDGNKSNNSVNNLEWATYSENNHHRYDVLNARAPGKWSIDIYKNGELLYSDVCLMECADAGFSMSYLRSIHEKTVNKYFVYFEKTEQSGVRVYWNGEVIAEYQSVKIAAESYGMALHQMYHKMKHHKDVEYICRDYKFIFKDVDKKNEKGVTTKLAS